MTPVLEISELEVGYSGCPVLARLSVMIEPAKVVALLGRNGAGKSTLLRAIAGLIKPNCGSIRLRGQRLDGSCPRKRVQMGISLVAQGRECFPGLTIAEHLQVAMSCLSLAKVQREERQREVLSLFRDLRPLLHRTSEQLSGGQQQLLVLAMALCQHPTVLLLDEPSLGLGQATLTVLQDALKAFVHGGCGVLLVEQKFQVASALAERILFLENGCIEIQGAASELLNNREFMQRYLGLPGGDKPWSHHAL